MTKKDDIKKEEKHTDEDLEFIESDDEGNPITKKDIESKLRKELKDVKAQRDEYLTGWQRAKADYVNLQKELSETRLSSGIFAKIKVIENILPVIDSFDMAFSNKESWEKVDENWRKGIEYIYQQFVKSFENLNVSKINDIDVDFDPNIHEPIGHIDTDKNELDNKVAEIIQTGYIMVDSVAKNKVIRPAKVKVYKYE